MSEGLQQEFDQMKKEFDETIRRANRMEREIKDLQSKCADMSNGIERVKWLCRKSRSLLAHGSPGQLLAEIVLSELIDADVGQIPF